LLRAPPSDDLIMLRDGPTLRTPGGGICQKLCRTGRAADGSRNADDGCWGSRPLMLAQIALLQALRAGKTICPEKCVPK
jgi:hypothetical protein